MAAFLALGTGAAALLTAPPDGVEIHWSGDGGAPGRAAPLAYAAGSAVIVLVLGLYGWKRGEERSARLGAVAAALLTSLCALQGLFGLGLFPSLALSTVLGAAVYLTAASGALSN